MLFKLVIVKQTQITTNLYKNSNKYAHSLKTENEQKNKAYIFNNTKARKECSNPQNGTPPQTNERKSHSNKTNDQCPHSASIRLAHSPYDHCLVYISQSKDRKQNCLSQINPLVISADIYFRFLTSLPHHDVRTAYSLDKCYNSRLLFPQKTMPFFPKKKKKKIPVKLDQHFQTLCKTQKTLYPALSSNCLSEHTNLEKKAGSL